MATHVLEFRARTKDGKPADGVTEYPCGYPGKLIEARWNAASENWYCTFEVDERAPAGRYFISLESVAGRNATVERTIKHAEVRDGGSWYTLCADTAINGDARIR